MATAVYNPHYLAGIEAFNRQAYFHSHDLWEAFWTAEGRPTMGFAKGLIQVAVAMHHLSRGNRRGFEKLWASCQEQFAGLGPRHLGIEVPKLVAQMKRCYESSDASGDPPWAAAMAPQIALTADADAGAGE
jgi:predicted metal-dependent hydrolase